MAELSSGNPVVIYSCLSAILMKLLDYKGVGNVNEGETWSKKCFYGVVTITGLAGVGVMEKIFRESGACFFFSRFHT